MSELSAQQAIWPGFSLARSGPDHVAILMATFNGADVIDAQLDSIARQTHHDWSLIVSDDGSTDRTAESVRAFAARLPHKKIALIRGPKRGSAQNFLSLLRAAGSAPYVAFSDQDDVWFDDKIARAVGTLKEHSGPTVYGSRTMVTDHALTPLRASLRFSRPTGFGNALVQNVAGGNTMVLNRDALNVLQPASQSATRIVSHDWWCYQMVTGIGGRMLYDPVPSLFYRQHCSNQIGANDTFGALANRLRRVANGEFSTWLDGHFDALVSARKWLTPQARRTLDICQDFKNKSPVRRLHALNASGVYRQTKRGSAALLAAALSGRL